MRKTLVLAGAVTAMSEAALAQVPECGRYAVQPGDTLSAIAARSGVALTDIVAANDVEDADLIRPGTVLSVPCAEGAGAAGLQPAEGEGSTMPKVSEELSRQFEMRADTPGHTEQVIVTLASGADRSVLEQSGATVVSEMNNAPIVVGRVDAKALQALSESDGVERIELDSSGMRALD